MDAIGTSDRVVPGSSQAYLLPSGFTQKVSQWKEMFFLHKGQLIETGEKLLFKGIACWTNLLLVVVPGTEQHLCHSYCSPLRVLSYSQKLIFVRLRLRRHR